MTKINNLDHVIQYAIEKHAGQVRKSTQIPYIIHPLEALAIAARITDKIEVLAAAVLHDVVEDTDVSLEELERQFGKEVASLVASASEDKMDHLPAEKTWEARKQATLDQLDTASYNEKIVVLADKLSNVRSIYNDLIEKGEQLWLRFNQTDKTKQAWYYRSILNKLAELDNTLAYKEYEDLLNNIFGDSRNESHY